MSLFYDVFNGDADGICALHQLRLAAPRPSVLVTGTKRDIALLHRVPATTGDEITVCDISLARNRSALLPLLEQGVRCRYFDHHFAGEIPAHSGLEAHIDTAADVCTSLLVDRYLTSAHRAWAVVAAFGDNLALVAREHAGALALDEARLALLEELGVALNYNAYGDSVEDLHYHPADLYQAIHPYVNPLDFIASEPVLEILRTARADDLFRAQEIKPYLALSECAVYVLPDAAWSRRVSGTLGNNLAQSYPHRAHAVLTVRASGYTVSVRAPLDRPQGADALCREFGGGGRRAAAGIDQLPDDEFTRFVSAFRSAYCHP